MDDDVCACGRRALICVDDPASRAGAVAMIAAHMDREALHIDDVIGDDACLLGVLNQLASLAARFVRTQRRGWLTEFALAPTRKTIAAADDEPHDEPHDAT